MTKTYVPRFPPCVFSYLYPLNDFIEQHGNSFSKFLVLVKSRLTRNTNKPERQDLRSSKRQTELININS